MKTIPGWLAGIIIAGVILLAGVLGYSLVDPSAETNDPVETAELRDHDTREDAATQDAGRSEPDRRAPAPRRDANSRRSGEDTQAQTLRVLGLDIDDSDPDLPAACIQLSAATDPSETIEDKAFIRVEPATPFSLEARGRELCVLGLDVDETYTVRVLPGLAAQDGRTLEQAAELSATFAPKPPMVGFVGDGIILPRQGDSVLGIKAVNAGEVELTLYRVNHRALFQSVPNAGETAIEGQWSWSRDAYQTRVAIHSETFDMSGPTNRLVERGFALGDIVSAQGPGAYIVEVERVADDTVRRAAKSWRWLYVTDIALASYRSEDALHVTARSIATARTLPGVRLGLVARNNDVLAEAVTDAQGRAVIPGAQLGGTGNFAPKMLMAYAGEEDFAALDLSRSPLDLSGFDVAGADSTGDVQAFLYTDRGVYRPGETVRLTALVRDRAGKAALDREGTLEVTKPDGSALLEVRVEPGGMAGAVFRNVDIPRGAPRGRYTATLSLDGKSETVGTLRFAVEDFVPEQLGVELRAGDGVVVPGEPHDIVLASDFLYGAPGRGLDAELDVRVQADPKPFADYAGYTFGNAVDPFREQFVPMDRGVTDEAGRFRASLDFAADQFDTTTPLRALVTAGVAEPSGRFIRDSAFVPVRAASTYVGFKPDFANGYARRGTPARIDIVALNAAGERVARQATLRLIREDYDYQWFRENGRWRYRRDRRDRRASTREVTIPAAAPLTFERTLDFGQYRVEIEVDGQVHSLQFGSGWRRSDGGTDAPDRFEIGLDAANYEPGDTLALTLNAPFAGEAELVVADGGVQRIESLSVREGAQTVRVRTSGDSEGDLYVMATLYSPLTDEAPRRAVGLVHVPRDRDAHVIDLSVAAPGTIRPRTTQVVRVASAERLRGEAYVTLAAVDTGILQITDFDPPDPVDALFGKKAFALDVFDDYARMLAPFNGVDRVGGDTLGGSGLSVVPTQTVALWEGPVRFNGRVAEIELDIPDFQGELTLMAVAWTEDRIGGASTTMKVRDPVTAQLSLPRFLAPGDEAVLTLALDNVDGRSGDYRSVVTRDGESVGEATKTLAVGSRAEDTFVVKAGDVGISTFALATRGPGFEVARDYSIETRAPAMPQTLTERSKLEAGDTTTVSVSDLSDGLVRNSMDVSLSATFSPFGDPVPLLDSLARYPYGCTEQTTSVAVPLLLSERVGTLPGQTRSERRDAVQAAVDTLLARQDANGAIGLWRQGDGNASPYLQIYASEFLLGAHEAGYDIPDSAVSRTLGAVRTLSALDGPSRLSLDYNFGLRRRNPDYEVRRAERAAYAHAVLAQFDRVEKTDLTYLADRFGERMDDSVALSQLGFALASIGEDARAAEAFARAEATLSETPDYNYYNTPVRNASALLALGGDLLSDRMSAALRILPEATPNRLNTHEKAWLLRAIAQAGEPTAAVPFADAQGWTRFGPGARREVERTADTLEVANPHDRPIWLTLTVAGQPSGVTPATDNGVALSKSLFRLSGDALEDNTIARGERAVVLLTAKPTARDSAMWVMADLLPAGFEIETVLSPADAGERGAFGFLGELTEMDLQEARDDRFIASWRVGAENRWDGQAERRVAYVVRAVTEGDFAFPGAQVEDMYRPERNATTEGGRLRVSAGGEL